MKKNSISIILIVLIILLINFLSKEFFFRIDTTADKLYTLSKASKNILNELEEPITVTGYFTEDLPPQYSKNLDDFKDLLIEYNRRSGGMVNYEFIDPNAAETEQEAAQNGIQPLLINVRDKDQVIQKKAFMGAIVKSELGQEILPFIQPEGPMEYQLTTAIKKISVSDKPTIGMVTGHGELATQEIAEIYQELSVLYDIETVDLSSGEIPTRLRTVLLARPQDSIPMAHFDVLDNYLASGGNLCIAVNAVIGDFQSVQGSEANTMIPEWLEGKGVRLNKDFVLDAQCGSISVQQKQSFFSFSSQVQFPYFPMVAEYEDHPITKGIDQVMFPFASSIENVGSNTMIPIVKSSSSSATLTPPIFFDVQKKWRQSDFPEPAKTIGAIIEGDLAGTGTSGKMVLFSDADFLSSQGRNSRTNADNFSLIVNSVDWLSDDTGLIDLRTKGVASRPIKELEDSTVSTYKWVNFLMPLILVLVLGIYRNQRNRNLRVKRMTTRYEA